MKKIIPLFLTALFCTGNAYAEMKIGYINIKAVVAKSTQTKKATKMLEKEFAPRKTKLLAAVKTIKKLEEKITRDNETMNASELRKLEKEILSKQRNAQRMEQEFKEDLSIRRDEELAELQKQVAQAIDALLADEKYDLLLDSGVLHASDAVDITDKVADKLNKLTDE